MATPTDRGRRAVLCGAASLFFAAVYLYAVVGGPTDPTTHLHEFAASPIPRRRLGSPQVPRHAPSERLPGERVWFLRAQREPLDAAPLPGGGWQCPRGGARLLDPAIVVGTDGSGTRVVAKLLALLHTTVLVEKGVYGQMDVDGQAAGKFHLPWRNFLFLCLFPAIPLRPQNTLHLHSPAPLIAVCAYSPQVSTLRAPSKRCSRRRDRPTTRS